MTRVPVVALAAALLLIAAPVVAKKKAAIPRNSPAATVAPADGITPEAKAAAKEHFAAGEKFFAEGKFAEAKGEYDAAYRSWPLDGFLFNIAQCERNLGHTDSAIDYFERYLKTPKAEKNRGEVQAVLVELRRKQDEDKRSGEARVAAAAAADAKVAADAKAAAEAKAAADAKAAAAAVAAAPVAEVKANPLTTPPPTPTDTTPIYKKKAFWIATAIAVVVVAGGATGIALGANANHLPPGGSLGVVDWR